MANAFTELDETSTDIKILTRRVSVLFQTFFRFMFVSEKRAFNS